MPITFLSPAFFVLILIAVPVLKLWTRRRSAVGFSHLRMQKNLRSLPVLAYAPILTFVLATGLMAGAAARPVVYAPATKVIDARDVVIAVDISNNMTEPSGGYSSSSYYGGGSGPVSNSPVTGHTPTQGCGSPSDWGQTKMDLAAYSVCFFAEHRPGDRLALEAFDGNTYWHAPLTPDLRIIQRKSYILNKYIGDGNTNLDGPNASQQEGMGPIQAAIDHFKKYGQSKSKVFIIITDGDASIATDRMASMTAELKAMGVHVYVLGVGVDSVSSDPGTMDLNMFCTNTNGVLFDTGDAQKMQSAMQQINQLEPTQEKLEQGLTFTDLYPWFLLASAFMWLLYRLSVAATRQMD